MPDTVTVVARIGAPPTVVVVPGQVVSALTQSNKTPTVIEVFRGPAGAQGPQGPQGPQGLEGGASEQRTASEDLGGHRIVRSTGNDTVGYASSANAAHGDDTQGMTTGAAASGASVDVQRIGSVVFSGWNWTQGEPVYLGAAGVPTQTPPSPENGDAFSQVIGHAEAPTVIFLSIETPIYF